MKSVSLPVLFIIVAMLVTANAEKPKPDPLLDRPISASPAGPPLEGAIRQAEKDTGFKVTCPEDTKKVVQEVRSLGPVSSMTTPIKTIRDYIDNLCSPFALNWKFNAQDKTIALDLPWRVADPRPASKLFQAIWKPEAVSKMDPEAIWDYRLSGGHPSVMWGGKRRDPALLARLAADAEWQPAFSALLSKEDNFARAAKARQFAECQGLFQGPRATVLSLEAPFLEAEMVDTKGDQYFCVFFREDAGISPGRDCLNYYWFRPDGTLVGAGLMSLGWRCFWGGARVETSPAANPAKPSEFVLKLQWSDFQFTRRFVLGSEGLQYSPGTPAEYFNELGESLLVPPEKRKKRPESFPPEFRR